jgi:flagellar basal-body rod modification protein FlgD
MAVDSVGLAATASTAPKNATLGQEDFMKILLTQLQFQDPLKPMDNQEFMAQMAQFTSLEISRQQSDNTETLLAIQSASQALNLIGKEVEVQTDGVAQIGIVKAVAFQGGVPVMTVQQGINGAFLTGVRLSQVSLVRIPTP